MKNDGLSREKHAFIISVVCMDKLQCVYLNVYVLRDFYGRVKRMRFMFLKARASV